jgi:metal-sulfur cluster biosynthetic enzyme
VPIKQAAYDPQAGAPVPDTWRATMPIQEETVYEALKQVRDPELMINVVDLGLIYGVALEDAGEKTNLGVMMTMTTPACPYGPQLLADVRDALKALDGSGEVKVEVTLSPPWSPEMMTEAARDELGMF